VLVCAACARPLPAPAAPTIAFQRSIAPFAVADSSGHVHALPFLGGFEHPRPQLVDIDGDGVHDLFLQENANDLALYQRSAEGWRLTAERFQQLDIGEWYRFADFDGDGLVDLFAESPLSYIRYYRNVGTRAAARFVVAADTVRDATGQAIYADRQNIPQFADIDCNGKLDLLLGRVDGTITRYELRSGDSLHPPRFQLVTERFQDIQIIGQLQPSRHGANTMAVFDVDGDGDPDILWGDFFEPGLLWLRNIGTCEHPDFHGERVGFPPGAPLATSGYNAPAAGDLNGDGRLDLVVGVLGGAFNPNKTSAANLYQLEQRAPNAWTLVTDRMLDGIDLGAESIPAAGDLDGDGDLDLVVGTKIEPGNPRTGGLYWFENTGTAAAPVLQLRGHLDVPRAFHLAPALGDLDGDGKPDLVLGQFQDAVAWYRNGGAGAARFQLVDSAVVRLPRGSNGVPELYDIDHDGDLDLFVGDAGGRVAFFRNTGSPRAPRFTLEREDYVGARSGRRVVPRFWNGRLILGTERGGLDSTLGVLLPRYAAPVFVQLRGSTIDLLVGGAGGGLLYFEGRTPSK
jgi:hypothetical protein